MTNSNKEISNCSVEIDLENGFAWAEDNNDKNLFQVCLMQRKDESGYKKQIDTLDCGHDDGICGDYNSDVNEDLEESLSAFLKLCRKSGIKTI